MRERLSGAIIIVALGVIFIPMLFDDPAPRDSEQTPVLTIDQPVDVERTEVDDPQPPESLSDEEVEAPNVEDVPEDIADTEDDSDSESASTSTASDTDPIAELARDAEEGGDSDDAASESEESDDSDAEQEPETTAPTADAEPGQWAVQVGSFREIDNAEGLASQLSEEGFTTYQRERDDDLTSVYVGPFDSSEDGEQAMNDLKERVNIQGLLVRVREDG
ncbi:SPOR domain-containing protein [Aidingimonas halophila]|nr:SPOR domain-containing protein [Aidingimonas halophila]